MKTPGPLREKQTDHLAPPPAASYNLPAAEDGREDGVRPVSPHLTSNYVCSWKPSMPVIIRLRRMFPSCGG